MQSPGRESQSAFRLCFAFAEAGIEWLPWLIHVMDSYWRTGQEIFKNDPGFSHSKTKPSEILRMATSTSSLRKTRDLREPLKLIGERSDHARIRYAAFGKPPQLFQKLQERSDLRVELRTKILSDNARQFFSR